MTPDEVQALARRIADLLASRQWIRGPVRPEPPSEPTPAKLPPWAGSALPLADVAPIRKPEATGPTHRPSYPALSAAARAAAAGRGPSPLPAGRGERGAREPRGRRVPVAVSNRHVHLAEQHVELLLGPGGLTSDRPITQPEQYAAHERLTVEGPGGSIEGVRVVGPPRSATQVELAASDCAAIGVDAPVSPSGSLAESAPIRLRGSHGAVDLPAGAIVAERHLHLSAEDAARWGLQDGDRVSVALGEGTRAATLPNVLVRSGSSHATELHVDADEARAFGIDRTSTAELLGRPQRNVAARTSHGRRRVVTERDVDVWVAEGRRLGVSPDLIVTPAARDRAKALGIWQENP